MHTDTTRQDLPPDTFAQVTDGPFGGMHDQSEAYARVADVILDDLFLSVGQAIGLRATVDYDAVVWLRSHFRAKFLTALRHQGDRWLEDRTVVTAVSALFAERAVRNAGGASSISVDDVRQAAADVERYCRVQARRAGSARGSDAAMPLIAGVWCTWDPEP